ncbi:MAG: peptide-methionine (R)-S-oxide reductase [Arenicella sp.]|jgi:peptide-methionine (R)-S-oxide reductase
MKRRHLLTLTVISSAAAIPLFGSRTPVAYAMKDEPQLDQHPDSVEPFALDDAEWKMRLDEEAYYVLRKEGTERPYTSEHNNEKRDGEFVCAGCNLALFESDKKFDSGTGWPSFWQPIEPHVETKRDFKLILPRTEYHCARCGGHQGHIFKDGPKPTGLRYCNNGVALKFVPA